MHVFVNCINNSMQVKEFRKQYSYYSKSKSRNIITQEKMIELQCDCCGEIHTRLLAHYKKMQTKFPEFDKDYCNKCWIPILNNRPEKIKKVKDGLVNAYNTRPELRQKISDIVKGRHAGDKNPMKRSEVRKKVSETRSKLMLDPAYRAKFRQPSLDAWARGCYDNVNIGGYASWHTYQHSNGKQYKVQGRYELAFIKYLDENDMTFDCHKGKIPYVDDAGNTHHYFPDFYVHKWKCYVDPKATHWLKKQYKKFKWLSEQHPDIEIRVLTEDKLREIGVKV